MESPIQATEPVIPGPEFQEPESLIPCSLCNRKFVPESLVRHRRACEKVLMKKRKQFDSAKQRLTGELAECLPLPMTKIIKRASPIRKSSRWKEKHLQLLETLRAAREGSAAPSLSKPTDHEQCPHCGRSFGPKAFDRHVEYCKEKFSRLENVKPNISLQAKERLEARTKYRAPCVKSKRSITREKYLPPNKREPSPTGNNVTSPVASKPTEVKRNSLSNTKENINSSSAAVDSNNKSLTSSNTSNFVRSNRTTSSFRSSQRRPSNKSIASTGGASIIVPVQKPAAAVKQPLGPKSSNTQENALPQQTAHHPVLRQTLQTLPSNMKIKKELINSRLQVPTPKSSKNENINSISTRTDLTGRNDVGSHSISEETVDPIQVELITLCNNDVGDSDCGNLIDFNTPRQEYCEEKTNISLGENLIDQSEPLPLFDFYGPNPSSDQSSSEHTEEALKNPLLDYLQPYASSSDSGFDSTMSRNCVNDIGGIKGPSELQPGLIGNGSGFKPYKVNKGLKPLQDGGLSCNQIGLLSAETTNSSEETLQKCQPEVNTTEDDKRCQRVCNKNPRKVNVEKSPEKSSLAQHLLQEMERTSLPILPNPKSAEHVHQKRNAQSNSGMKDSLTKDKDGFPSHADLNVSNFKTALYNDTLHGFLEKSFNTPRGVTRTISRKIINDDNKTAQECLEDGTPRAKELTKRVKGASRIEKKDSGTKENEKKKTPMKNSDNDSLTERNSSGKSRRKLKMPRKKILESDDSDTSDTTVTSDHDEPYDSLDDSIVKGSRNNNNHETHELDPKLQMFELFLNDNLVDNDDDDDDDDESSIDDEELIDIANKMNQLSARKHRSKNESNEKFAENIRETDAKEPNTPEEACRYENDTTSDALFKPIDPAPRESVRTTNPRLLALRNAKKSLDLSTKLGIADAGEDCNVLLDSVLEISKDMKTLTIKTKLESPDPNTLDTTESHVENSLHAENKQPVCVPMQDNSRSTLPDGIKLPRLNLKNTKISTGNKATEMKPKRGNNSTVITLPPLVHPLKKKVNSRIPKAKTLYTAKHYLGDVVKKTTGLGNVSGVGVKLPPIIQSRTGLSMSCGDGLCHVKEPSAVFPCSRSLETIQDGVDRVNDSELLVMPKMGYIDSPYANSTMTEQDGGGGDLFGGEKERGSRGNKAAGDSAYNSLSRKGTDLASSSNSSGSESSFPTQPDVSRSTTTKFSKFCHECGTQYPLSSAKFCCQCGVRRLVLA